MCKLNKAKEKKILDSAAVLQGENWHKEKEFNNNNKKKSAVMNCFFHSVKRGNKEFWAALLVHLETYEDLNLACSKQMLIDCMGEWVWKAVNL